jgi:dihydroorotase
MGLLLKNILVFRDGEWKPTDVAIEGDRIRSLADPGEAGSADETREFSGLYASPGWVDIHTHLLPLRYGGIGTHTKKIGLRAGVTALLDVGTVGAKTFHKLRDKVVSKARLPVKCLLNIKKTGIRFWKVGRDEPSLDDIPAMERVAGDNPDLICGVKVTASKEHMLDSDPMYYVRKAIEAGEALGLPVMIHIGRTPPSLKEIMPLMRPGDVLTHCFRNGPHNILDASGKIREEVLEAKGRGGKFDIGHGVKSFSFPVAEKALEQEFDDFSISSDLYMLSTPYRAVSFANVLTKFLALGMKLEDVMHRASVVPAELMGLERGIEPGKPASITVFKLAEGHFKLKDCWNRERTSNRRIRPVGVVHQGKLIDCS